MFIHTNSLLINQFLYTPHGKRSGLFVLLSNKNYRKPARQFCHCTEVYITRQIAYIVNVGLSLGFLQDTSHRFMTPFLSVEFYNTLYIVWRDFDILINVSLAALTIIIIFFKHSQASLLPQIMGKCYRQ